MRFFRTASKIAWRELRATPSRFLFVIIAVAVGVGALSGVKGFGAAFSSMLFRNAKQLTASDLSAQVWGLPTDRSTAAVAQLARETGSELTWVTETVSMAAPERGGVPQMVSVKAVDPAAYPFYGALTLSIPPSRLASFYLPTSVLVNQELLIRLRVKPGDTHAAGRQSILGSPGHSGDGTGSPCFRLRPQHAGDDDRDALRPHRADAARQPRRPTFSVQACARRPMSIS